MSCGPLSITAAAGSATGNADLTVQSKTPPVQPKVSVPLGGSVQVDTKNGSVEVTTQDESLRLLFSQNSAATSFNLQVSRGAATSPDEERVLASPVWQIETGGVGLSRPAEVAFRYAEGGRSRSLRPPSRTLSPLQLPKMD